MMACSQDSDFDLEAKNTLSRNFDDILQGSESEPLSPILGRGLSLNRQYLIERRLRNGKSRVKLSDRFKENNNEKGPSYATPLKEELFNFSEESLAVIEYMDMVKQIEMLEEIENKRDKIYSMLIVGEENNEFCFKKRGSPLLLNEAKKPKICDKNEDVIKNEPPIESVERIYRLSECPSHVDALPPSSGFQTATGKSINVSDVDIKRHSKLFDDIISGSNQKYNLRQNKYVFLSKSSKSSVSNTGVLKSDIKLAALSERDLSNHESSKTALNSERIKFNPSDVVLEGTKTRLDAVNSKQVHKQGTLRPDKHISLTQEIWESSVSDSQMLLAVDEALNSIKNDIDELDQNFRGLDEEEEVAGYEKNIFQQRSASNICEIFPSSQSRKLNKRSVFSITKQIETNIDDIIASGECITDDLPLPPAKRIRNINSLENVEDSLSLNIENKENHRLSFNENLGLDSVHNISSTNMKKSNNNLLNKNNICDDMEQPDLSKKELTAMMVPTSISELKTVLNPNGIEFGGGFRSASGKHIAVSDNSIKRAQNIFDDIDSDLPKGNSNLLTNQGFCSASSKQIMVSDRSLNKTKTIFNDIHSGIPIKNVSKDKAIYLEDITLDTPNKVAFQGFSNASGKQITISDRDLNKAKAMFDDIDSGFPTRDLSEGKYKSLISDSVASNITVEDFPNTSGQSIEGSLKIYSGLSDFNLLKKNRSETSGISAGKNIFHDIDSDLPKGNSNLLMNQGFRSASGKQIKISHSSLNKAKTIFNDIDSDIPIKHESKDKAIDLEDITLDTPNKVAFQGFSSASGKQITISDRDLNKSKAMFDDIDSGLPTRDLSEGKHKSLISDSAASNIIVEDFPNTSGKSIEITLKNYFGLSDFNLLKKNRSKTSGISASHSYQKVTRSKLEILEPTIPDRGENDDSSSVKNNESTTSRVKNIFADFDLGDIQPIHDTNLPLNPGFKISKHDSLKVLNPGKTYGTKNVSTSETTTLKSETKPRKRLASCKLLQFSDDKLEKAKLLFDKDFSKMSPLGPTQSNVYASTAIRQNSCVTPNKVDLRPSSSSIIGEAGAALSSRSTPPIRYDIQKPARSFSSFIEGAAITSIKPNATDDRKDHFYEQSVLLASPTKGTIVDWLSKLQDDREKLEGRLRIILERQRLMKRLNREKSEEEKRPREGVLHHCKATSNKISLEFFVDNKRPGEESVNYDLFDITPENAEYVHFKDQYPVVEVTTEDGAIVIPNLHDVIGVSEIETAFMAMPGVDPRLVPKGWIRNHYRWIIWKLTSYARMFPVKFGSCLNIENVVQQLKYRYDREVDRAERSALRKIYEKDDVPQKRLVLCVSHIKKMTTSGYELELTDGWYSIRTVIDEPLKNQIHKKKIEVGTKLLISGAELLHCDGCYPLEATSLTCLKIRCNCTRRVHWNTRLGYQRNLEYFPIPIQSVHPLGGLIGAIKVCIVRVYPLKYLEKSDGHSVWRNRKAEERRAQQSENERCKKIEGIQEDVTRGFENSHRGQNLYSSKRHCSVSSGVSSPRTLCEILENSDDPESVQRNLTSSQQAAILDYQDNLYVRKQLEVAERIKEDVHKLGLSRRDVVAALKLLLMDINGKSDRGFSFFVWKPGETHMQILREGTIVTFQNVLPTRYGYLNSCSKTIFRPESPAPHLYNNFKRRLTHIAELTHSLNFSPTYNEFDTIGLVVHVKVEPSSQDVWLTDRLGRLLLVHVYEGPSTCLLLDSLKRGQATTVCNLIYRGVTGDVSQALANHYTVFSCYSQHRHLQEGLDVFLKQLPKDVDVLLKCCDTRMEVFRMQSSDIRNTTFSTTFEDDDDDESSMASSRLTSIDVALSLIDMDKFT